MDSKRRSLKALLAGVALLAALRCAKAPEDVSYPCTGKGDECPEGQVCSAGWCVAAESDAGPGPDAAVAPDVGVTPGLDAEEAEPPDAQVTVPGDAGKRSDTGTPVPDAALACGKALGDPCCSGAGACNEGTCVGGTCLPCGAAGEACCAGASCDGALTCTTSGTCAAPGTKDGPCEPGSDGGWTCPLATQCVRGVCLECGERDQSPCVVGTQIWCSGSNAIGPGGLCVKCGDVNEPCCGTGECAGGCCDSPIANGYRKCIDSGGTTTCPIAGGICTAVNKSCGGPSCGGSGQPCCAVGGVDGGTCFGSTLTCWRGATCASCGSGGGPCCAGGTCSSRFARCDQATGTCLPCGVPHADGGTDRCCPVIGCVSGCCGADDRCVAANEKCQPNDGICTASGQCTGCGLASGACCSGADAGTICFEGRCQENHCL